MALHYAGLFCFQLVAQLSWLERIGLNYLWHLDTLELALFPLCCYLEQRFGYFLNIIYDPKLMRRNE
jgi:hypothetical protein